MDALPVSAYRHLPRPPDTWIIRDILPTAGLLSLYGDPKVGKSFAALQLAYAVTSSGQSEWLGFEVCQHGQCLYIQLDTPRGLWVEEYLDRFTDASQALPDTLLIADREMAPFPFNILAGDAYLWLHTAAGLHRPAVVILDSLRDAHEADEDKSQQMQHVVTVLRAAVSPAALVLISHARKPNYQLPPDVRDNLMSDNRGSSYVPGKADTIIKLTEKTLHIQGRTIQKHRLRAVRNTFGLWELAVSETEAAVAEVLADVTLPSMSARTKALAELLDRSPEACRSLLRRAMAER